MVTSGLAELTEEPAGGRNHGRSASPNPGVEGRHLPLDVGEQRAHEFMRSGGWTVVTGAGGERQRAGMTAHRTVLHLDEHVDRGALSALVERELGFTLDDVHDVYRQGPLPAAKRELRGQIDARLLALQRSGANMALLGRLLGFRTTGNTMPRAVKGALGRARAAEAA